ncbi:UTRA domain-containing protein [Peribacillus simplex]
MITCEPSISPEDMLNSLKRLRIVDNIPVAIELSQIPYKFCSQIEEYISTKVSLYKV